MAKGLPKDMSEESPGAGGIDDAATNSSGTANYHEGKGKKDFNEHMHGKNTEMKHGGNNDYHGLAAHKHIGHMDK